MSSSLGCLGAEYSLFFFPMDIPAPREEAKEIEAKLIWDHLTDADSI